MINNIKNNNDLTTISRFFVGYFVFNVKVLNARSASA